MYFRCVIIETYTIFFCFLCRLNNCKNLEEMASKLDVLSKMEADEIIELEKQTWTRSAPADLYYKRHPS